MLGKEPEEAEMLGMIPNIQNLKGNQNEERYYYTTILHVYYRMHSSKVFL